MSQPLHGAGLTAVICVLAVLVAGCGSSAQSHNARQLENASILSGTAPLSERLVKQSEIESASDTAAVRTFLQLWSLLQFQAWDQAEEVFQPGLRSTIGPSLLAEALAADVIVWQATKPHIVTTRAIDSKARITFLARGETGAVIPTSISFERTNGSWLVSYLPLLDWALQRTAQTQAQARIAPLATKPSAEAVRQGFAASVLQSTYLERGSRAHAAGGHAAAKP